MPRFAAFAGLLALVLCADARAKPAKDENVAGAIAFLLRIRDGACPGMRFDPLAMSRLIDPKGLSLDAVKARFKKDFDESYAEAGSRIAAEGMPAYCETVRGFFGKSLKEFPGLTIR